MKFYKFAAKTFLPAGLHRMKAKGFTLAEVLITLGIIGVVAAMTIPGLMYKTNTKKLETGFKLAYSMLSQSTRMVNDQIGPGLRYTYAGCSTYDGKMYTKKNDLFNGYKQTLKIQGNCKYWFPIKNYNSTASTPNTGGRWAYPQYALANGMCFGFLVNQCNINLTIDTNGTAQPNKLGHDIFSFQVDNSDELIPLKTFAEYNEEVKKSLEGTKFEDIDNAEYGNPCSAASTQKNNGYGCSWFALHNQCPDNPAKTYWDGLRSIGR